MTLIYDQKDDFMRTFSIENKALKKIQSILEKNYYSDQVAVLVDVSDPGKMMDEIKNDFLQENDQDKLISEARKRYAVIKDHLSFRVTVVVYENKNLSQNDLIDISGITFAMCSNDRRTLRGFCLIYEDDCFLLKNDENVFCSLQSINTN